MGGRNYNNAMGRSWGSMLGSALAVVAEGEAKCAAGEHDEQVVPANRRAYGPYGVARPTGTRYCGRCQIDLPEAGEAAVDARENTTQESE